MFEQIATRYPFKHVNNILSNKLAICTNKIMVNMFAQISKLFVFEQISNLLCTCSKTILFACLWLRNIL